MTTAIGILIFDGAEELDFVGPWEVFTMANELSKRLGKPVPHEVMLVAEHDAPVRCAKDMRVLPDVTAPSFDAHLVYADALRQSKRVAAFRDFLVKGSKDWQY